MNTANIGVGIVDCLRSAVMEGGAGLKDVPGLLRRTIDEGLWRERVIIRTGEVKTFERFIDFVTTQPLEGLGANIETLRRLCVDDKPLVDLIDRAVQQGRGGRNNPQGVNQYTEVNDDNIHIDQKRDSPTGTSAAAALRRLRKDRPDLHAHVFPPSTV